MIAIPKSLDELLQEEVLRRTGGRVRDLAVEIAGDVVVLRGRTNSFHIKQLAQSGVRELLPEAPLRNVIEVN